MQYVWNFLERTFFRSYMDIEKYIETGFVPKNQPKTKKKKLEENIETGSIPKCQPKSKKPRLQANNVVSLMCIFIY